MGCFIVTACTRSETLQEQLGGRPHIMSARGTDIFPSYIMLLIRPA